MLKYAFSVLDDVMPRYVPILISRSFAIHSTSSPPSVLMRYSAFNEFCHPLSCFYYSAPLPFPQASGRRFGRSNIAIGSGEWRCRGSLPRKHFCSPDAASLELKVESRHPLVLSLSPRAPPFPTLAFLFLRLCLVQQRCGSIWLSRGDLWT